MHNILGPAGSLAIIDRAARPGMAASLAIIDRAARPGRINRISCISCIRVSIRIRIRIQICEVLVISISVSISLSISIRIISIRITITICSSASVSSIISNRIRIRYAAASADPFAGEHDLAGGAPLPAHAGVARGPRGPDLARANVAGGQRGPLALRFTDRDRGDLASGWRAAVDPACARRAHGRALAVRGPIVSIWGDFRSRSRSKIAYRYIYIYVYMNIYIYTGHTYPTYACALYNCWFFHVERSKIAFAGAGAVPVAGAGPDGNPLANGGPAFAMFCDFRSPLTCCMLTCCV